MIPCNYSLSLKLSEKPKSGLSASLFGKLVPENTN